ncbi:hypothetical protein QNO07_00030 [Streptomyces sp. 549]|uniref:hypothetical protein n=1 Tax=Streptomyces sp. 549 TaxID=3049076 RepID=UPI0024C324A3|nr:hypothetical protein [Streptomyces sp. 549]MDK1471829.1 hypothetical protein [Streptomyces sp. 549]
MNGKAWAAAALRREDRRLREDVEILKRATAFFANELLGVGVLNADEFRLNQLMGNAGGSA